MIKKLGGGARLFGEARVFGRIRYRYPDQTGITIIVPCLFAHNLVFDTNDLKFELY